MCLLIHEASDRSSLFLSVFLVAVTNTPPDELLNTQLALSFRLHTGFGYTLSVSMIYDYFGIFERLSDSKRTLV